MMIIYIYNQSKEKITGHFHILLVEQNWHSLSRNQVSKFIFLFLFLELFLKETNRDVHETLWIKTFVAV